MDILVFTPCKTREGLLKDKPFEVVTSFVPKKLQPGDYVYFWIKGTVYWRARVVKMDYMTPCTTSLSGAERVPARVVTLKNFGVRFVKGGKFVYYNPDDFKLYKPKWARQ
jgi:hypothetical protein